MKMDADLIIKENFGMWAKNKFSLNVISVLTNIVRLDRINDKFYRRHK